MKPIAGGIGAGRIAVIAVAILAIVAAIAAAPFLFTTQLVTIVIRDRYPANACSVEAARLYPAGLLIIRGLIIHDTGKYAGQPLVAAREVRVAFGWKELLSRKVRDLNVDGFSIYARVAGTSQLSLLELMEHRRRTAAPQVARLDLTGTLHSEPIPGFTGRENEWPLALHVKAGATPGGYLVSGSIGGARGADFGASADAEIQQAGLGVRLILRRLAARKASLAIASATLHHFVPALPQFRAPVSAGLDTLSASGEVRLEGAAIRVSGKVDFSGARLLLEGDPRIKLATRGAAGAIDFATPFPAGPATRISIRRLRIGKVEGSIDAEMVREYVRSLPDAVHGPIGCGLDSLDLSGTITGIRREIRFAGPFRIQNLSVPALSVGDSAVTITAANAAGDLSAAARRPVLASIGLRGGAVQASAIGYGTTVLSGFSAGFSLDQGILSVANFSGQMFDGGLEGNAASVDLVSGTSAPIQARIKSIDIHKLLANIAPDRIDADGRVSGEGEFQAGAKQALSGHLDLAFDGPGVLKVGEIPALEQRLKGNVGADMAQLAMNDLHHYPFTQGSVHLESNGPNTLLNIEFVRAPRTGAEKVKPRKEIIDGKEIWVGSLVVPKIDMSIPITGESLADILSIAAGLRKSAAGTGGVP